MNALPIPFYDETEKTPPLNLQASIDYYNKIKKLNILPLKDQTMYFSDDIWDLTYRKASNIPDTKLKLHFDWIPDAFRDHVKYIWLLKLLQHEVKIQTLYENLSLLSKFLIFAEQRGILKESLITLSDIKAFYASASYSPYREHISKIVVQDYLFMYSLFLGGPDLDTSISRYLLSMDSALLACERDKGNTPNITHEYYSTLLKALEKIAYYPDDDDLPYVGIACIYIILMQVGIRIGELLNVSINSMQYRTLPDRTPVPFLEYKTWKRIRGDQTAENAYTFVTPKAEKAFKRLIDFLTNAREQIGTEVLFVFPDKFPNASDYPINSDRFNKIAKLLFVYLDRYFPTIDVPEEQRGSLHTVKLGDGHTLTYPITRQFRVYVCRDLYYRGIPLEYIQKFMAHLLCRTTIDNYVQPKNAQENPTFTHNLLAGIITRKIEPLGGKPGLVEKIDEFIRENNYNVQTDIETICAGLAEKLPVREKAGGVCIKSSMQRDCSIDAETNDYLCSYDVCPNIYHFYFDAAYTLQNIKDLQISIKHNTQINRTRQVEKDKNMLQTIIRKRLIPELESLKSHLDKEGRDAILNSYPDLLYIVDNFDAIMKEAQEWITEKR